MGRSVLDVALLLGTQAGEDRRVPGSLSGQLDELGSIDVARATLATDVVSAARASAGSATSAATCRSRTASSTSRPRPRSPGVLDAIEPATIPVDLDELWDAWLLWRHLLIRAGLGALAADPAAARQIKPEALWEIDQAPALTADDMAAASEVRTRFALGDVRDVRPLRRTGDPDHAGVAVPGRRALAGDDRRRVMDTYHRWMEVTIYPTFAGLPAISVPAGFDERGLPIGVQLIGPPRADVDVLRIAATYEQTIAHLAVGGA